MKPQRVRKILRILKTMGGGGAALGLLVPGIAPARASVAFGTINNFDTVNDTGVECHGFEIEIEDIHSADIKYTYSWNHYGTPRITEDHSNPLHPKVRVRYESAKNPDGTWAAYTSIPSGPIAPTQGHQFTDPTVNFGGEHFGAGYRGTPTSITYHWLIDIGGALNLGPAVNIATPIFTYNPPAVAVPAQVQAAIVPPPPPVPDPLEFGGASWVKEIRTTTHNNNEVRLRDLVSDDPEDPNDKNWRNGEPDEVEVEWQILHGTFGERSSSPSKGIRPEPPHGTARCAGVAEVALAGQPAVCLHYRTAAAYQQATKKGATTSERDSPLG